MLLVALAAGGFPASGNGPEGVDGTTVNVLSSDDLPAASSIVTVQGAGFFPEASVADSTVFVARCVPAMEA